MQTNFNHEMLVLARESRGLTQAELARVSEITQGTISKIETGLLTASDEDVQRLSQILDYPIDFFSQNPTDDKSSLYRRRIRLPKKTLTNCDAKIQIFAMSAERLLASAEIIKDKTIFKCDPEEYNGDASAIAREMRRVLGIPRGPVKNLTWIIENAGCLVSYFDFGSNKIDGCSAVLNDGTPLILLNPAAPPDRMRWTLAHEFGHVIMHDSPSPEEIQEDQANQFAAELLMPAADIKGRFYPAKLQTFAALKLQWQASMQALIKRAEAMGEISSYTARYLFMNLGRRGYRIAEPYSDKLPTEKPVLFGKLIRCHTEMLGYTENDLLRLLRLNKRDLESYVTQPNAGLRLIA